MGLLQPRELLTVLFVEIACSAEGLTFTLGYKYQAQLVYLNCFILTAAKSELVL